MDAESLLHFCQGSGTNLNWMANEAAVGKSQSRAFQNHAVGVE
jgi:hypothetical protein